MFDTTTDISIKLKTPQGAKDVVVEFPSDEQWKARASKIKIVSKSLGRGKSTSEATKPERANAELFDQIVKIDVELDEFEKSQIVERLSRCEVTDSSYTGAGYEITLKVPGGEAKHTLNMPSAKQVNEYRRLATRMVSGQHGMTEFTVNLGAGESLYNAVAVKADGYGGPVPVVHKCVVISEVLHLLEDDGEDEIEGF
jgi:hypothetical protein